MRPEAAKQYGLCLNGKAIEKYQMPYIARINNKNGGQ